MISSRSTTTVVALTLAAWPFVAEAEDKSGSPPAASTTAAAPEPAATGGPADAAPAQGAAATAAPTAATPATATAPASPRPAAASTPAAGATVHAEADADNQPPSPKLVRWGEPGYKILFRFKQQKLDEPWVLVGPQGNTLCKLPCQRWVGAGAGLQLALDNPDTDKAELVPIPETLEYRSGRILDATVVPRRSATFGAVSAVASVLGMTAGFVGASKLGTCYSRYPGGDPSPGPYPCGAEAQAQFNRDKRTYRVVAITGLVVALGGATLAYLFWGHPPRLEVNAEPAPEPEPSPADAESESQGSASSSPSP